VFAEDLAAGSFIRPARMGSGRETLWVSPSTDIRFRLNGSRPPRINETWVHAIIATAGSPTGLQITVESVEAVADALATV